MRYLIDGYNLLYAMGVMPARAGPGGLARARLRLLGMLHGVFGADSGKVTVVFDAARAPPGAAEQETAQGIHVRYAHREPAADDLIEDLIRHESVPRQLAVVSDDHRLQQAARRRQCTPLGCLDFLDELARRRRLQRQRPGQPAEKTTAADEEETRHWLSAFGDLEADPDWKELCDPYGFGEGG
jgi:predicted RNA-binding protein with PIN domain